ncbi:MAG TPA: hypothetical protein VJY62_00460 [Bacteroidia bacterium]|jgi:hypothetical protein|nr:hypothetical protein [Bacteroidia bacterium]
MKALRTITFFTAVMFFYSCENFDWFRSEDTMNKQIQGTWSREFLTNNQKVELWTFKEGRLKVFSYDLAPYDTNCKYTTGNCDEGLYDVNRKDGNDTLILDSGSYSIDAKLTVSYLKTNELVSNGVEYNYTYKWTIIQIDDKILELVADRKDAAGNIQREFEKE